MLKRAIQQFLIITIIFILTGSLLNFWGLWILYLIPPMLLYKDKDQMNSTVAKIYHSFFLVTTVYIAIGIFFNIWHPTWLMYLLPVIFCLNKKS